MAKDFYTEEFMKNNSYGIPERNSFKDITGNNYGKIKVVSWAGINKYGNWKSKRNSWWCKCDCGDTDYFLVDRSSLEKGLTKSCGCNYKNNGGNIAETLEDLKGSYDSRYTVTDYKGRRHPCKVECKSCGDEVVLPSFYSLQQRGLVCSCDKNSVIGDNLRNKYNYELLETKPKGVSRIKCLSCGIEVEKNIYSVKDKCPCHYGKSFSENQIPAAVYLLVDKNNEGIYKIGKSITPFSRNISIQKSNEQEGYDHDFYLHDMKWFNSEKVAYHVESLYHQFFKDKSFYGFKGIKGRSKKEFDGAAEVFKLSREDFLDFNDKYKSHINFLQEKDIKFVVDHPFKETNIIISKDSSVGLFFPDKYKMFQSIGIKKCHYKKTMENNVIEDSTFNELKEWYESFKIEIGNYFEYKGVLYKNNRDYYDKNKTEGSVDFDLFLDRVNNKGLDYEEAISTPIKRINNKEVFKDVDGTVRTATFLYEKYKPLLSFTSYKDRIKQGECPLELAKEIPKNSITRVYLLGGKYYSNIKLYEILKPLVRKAAFYGRINSNWCPMVAACVDNVVGSISKEKDKKECISDLEKYNSLVEEYG